MKLHPWELINEAIVNLIVRVALLIFACIVFNLTEADSTYVEFIFILCYLYLERFVFRCKI